MIVWENSVRGEIVYSGRRMRTDKCLDAFGYFGDGAM